jgi:hypothetical protein
LFVGEPPAAFSDASFAASQSGVIPECRETLLGGFFAFVGQQIHKSLLGIWPLVGNCERRLKSPARGGRKVQRLDWVESTLG